MNSVDTKIVASLDNVSRVFGKHTALDDVTLHIPKGGVYGLCGVNGAGKTTLIRHILGLYKAAQGSVSVFGVDPAVSPEIALARIGYLSEEDQLPGWMTVGQLTKFYKAFYPDWDDDYESELIETFRLDKAIRLKSLSKGQRARAGLLIALAHRPDLLVLDEPSSGLDPIVRGDILEAIVRTIADEGRTVIFSSHLLDEVERVADRVAVIDGGKVIFNDELDSLKSRFQRISVEFETPLESPPPTDNTYAWRGQDLHWSFVLDSQLQDVQDLGNQLNVRITETSGLSLHDIFIATLRDKLTDHSISSSADNRQTERVLS